MKLSRALKRALQARRLSSTSWIASLTTMLCFAICRPPSADSYCACAMIGGSTRRQRDHCRGKKRVNSSLVQKFAPRGMSNSHDRNAQSPAGGPSELYFVLPLGPYFCTSDEFTRFFPRQ